MKIELTTLVFAAGILACSLVTRWLGLAPNPTSTASDESAPVTPTEGAQPTVIRRVTAEPATFVQSFQNYTFLTPWEDLPSGDLVLARDFGASRLDYITWEGQTGALLEVGLEPGEAAFNILGVTGTGNVIAMIDDSFRDRNKRIDFIDLRARRAWGYEAKCAPGELITTVAPGPVYLIYECATLEPLFINVSHGYRLVFLEGSPSLLQRPLPDEFDEADPSLDPPVWLDGETVYFVDEGSWGSDWTAACIISVIDWDPACLVAPYVFGSVSPDGRWIEVRDDKLGPARVAVIPTDCLREFSQTMCAPEWAQVDFQVGERGTDYPAVWTPDSRAFLLLNGPTDRDIKEGTDIWEFDAESGRVRLAGTLPYPPYPAYYWLPGGYLRPVPVWSPDGDRLLLLREGCPECDPPRTPQHYAFNVRDGSLTTLGSTTTEAMGVIHVP